MTLSELGARMSAAEFQQWKAYSLIEPFGETRADARAWMLAMQMANAAGAQPPIRLEDVLSVWKPRLSAEEVGMQLEMTFARQAAIMKAREG